MPSPATATHDRAPADRRARGVLVCAVAVLAAIVVYRGALHNPFIYDDYRLIVENPTLLDPSNLRALFWFDATRPVVNASFALDYALWGEGPFGFHLTSVILHALNAALVGILAWRVAVDGAARTADPRLRVRPEIAAPIASLLFAVHPIASQAVGYVSGRSEVLCATFFLLALISARAWMLHRRVWALAAACGLWALALGSREVTTVFPLVALAYDRWLLPADAGERRRRFRTLHAPLLTITVALGVARVLVLFLVEHPGESTARWTFALVALDTVAGYLQLVVRPIEQTIFHFVPAIESVFDPRAIRGAVVLTGLVVAGWLLRRRVPMVGLGLVWFPLLLAPSAALVILGRAEPLAEHRAYLASAGLFMAIAAAGAVAWNRATRIGRVMRGLVATATVLAVLVLAGRTVDRTRVWSDPVGVWAEAAALAPGHWLPRLALGEELHRAGDHASAIPLLEAVTVAMPLEPQGFAKLGICLAETGRFEEATSAFQTLLALDDRAIEAINGLAMIRLIQGDPEGARAGFQQALSIDQASLAAHRGMATAARVQHREVEADDWCAAIERLVPMTVDLQACPQSAGPGR